MDGTETHQELAQSPVTQNRPDFSLASPSTRATDSNKTFCKESWQGETSFNGVELFSYSYVDPFSLGLTFTNKKAWRSAL